MGRFLDGRLYAIAKVTQAIGFWQVMTALVVLLGFGVFAMIHSQEFLRDVFHTGVSFVQALFSYKEDIEQA
jgi:hypothetical protein